MHATHATIDFELRNTTPVGLSLRAAARSLCASAMAVALIGAAGFASTIDLASGAAGTFTPVPQSFNETRGVDVTVLSPTGIHVSTMTLDGLFIGGASSANVGARIYKSSNGALVASANATVTSSGSVAVPIAATLPSGGSFRISFYVATTPPSQGSGTMFDPNPPSIGGFPYIESSGVLRINAAYSLSMDTFPTNANIFVPLVKLTVTSKPGTTFCSGDGSLPTPCPCSLPNTVPSPSGAAGHGCANTFNLDGAQLFATGGMSPDTVVFTTVIGGNSAAFGLLLKGNASDANGVANGDGVRCVDGQLIRFGGHNAGTNGAPLGTWTYPNSAQTSPVSMATLQPPAQTAYYQLFYRNLAAGFCSPATTNMSNGIQLNWP